MLSIDGEARELVETIQGGIYVPPEDPIKMADVILKFQNSTVELDLMGNNGYEYTVQYHSRKALAEKLITYLEKFV